jgi:uncharacterized membrane protein
MNHTVFAIAGIFMLLTLLVCTAGIILMATGGEANKKYGTKLMAARVYLQAISIGLVAFAFTQ